MFILFKVSRLNKKKPLHLLKLSFNDYFESKKVKIPFHANSTIYKTKNNLLQNEMSEQPGIITIKEHKIIALNTNQFLPTSSKRLLDITLEQNLSDFCHNGCDITNQFNCKQLQNWVGMALRSHSAFLLNIKKVTPCVTTRSCNNCSFSEPA